MTQTEFRQVLRAALLGAAAALEDDECDHPREMRERQPMPMDSPVCLETCTACGEQVRTPWEEIEDGSS